VSGIVGRPSGSGEYVGREVRSRQRHRGGSQPYPTASVRLRLSVRLRHRGLDSQIAGGVDPSSSAKLTLRAWQLVQPASRRRVARALRRTVIQAHDHRVHGYSSIVPISRKAVVQCSQGLLGVADAIEQFDRVNACGMARALELITDGTGPLYNPATAYLLGTAVWSISDGLHADTQ
jgi:hypothetical protein